jgi:hypothetical protein
MDERREIGEEQSVPSNSAASAAVRSHNIVAIKVPQNAGGSAASKVEPMMDSDAMLTLIGQIIHVDHEYSKILHTKPHDVGPVQCRFTRHIVQYVHSLTFNEKQPSSDTISFWNKCGMDLTN